MHHRPAVFPPRSSAPSAVKMSRKLLNLNNKRSRYSWPRASRRNRPLIPLPSLGAPIGFQPKVVMRQETDNSPRSNRRARRWQGYRAGENKLFRRVPGLPPSLLSRSRIGGRLGDAGRNLSTIAVRLRGKEGQLPFDTAGNPSPTIPGHRPNHGRMWIKDILLSFRRRSTRSRSIPHSPGSATRLHQCL